jgi:hypothetical protein
MRLMTSGALAASYAIVEPKKRGAIMRLLTWRAPFIGPYCVAHSVLGPRVLETISGALNSASGNLVPVWNRHMPMGAPKVPVPHVPVARAVDAPRQLPRKAGSAAKRSPRHLMHCGYSFL